MGQRAGLAHSKGTMGRVEQVKGGRGQAGGRKDRGVRGQGGDHGNLVRFLDLGEGVVLDRAGQRLHVGSPPRLLLRASTAASHTW